MRSLPFLYLVLLPFSFAFTTKSAIGEDSQVGRQMIFDLEARMTCYYETLEKDMKIRLSVNPYPAGKSRFPLQMRLTSPSAAFSEWAEGDGMAKMEHDTTEDGDFEICLFAPRPVRVSLNIYFHHPEKNNKAFDEYLEKHQLSTSIQETLSKMFQYFYNIKYSIKYYNQVSLRDEAIQQTNADYIQLYSVVFIGTSIFLAIVQVTLVRRMFNIDTKRIRI